MRQTKDIDVVLKLNGDQVLLLDSIFAGHVVTWENLEHDSKEEYLKKLYEIEKIFDAARTDIKKEVNRKYPTKSFVFSLSPATTKHVLEKGLPRSVLAIEVDGSASPMPGENEAVLDWLLENCPEEFEVRIVAKEYFGVPPGPPPIIWLRSLCDTNDIWVSLEKYLFLHFSPLVNDVSHKDQS